MKEGDLVKVLYKSSEKTYAYGIVTDLAGGIIGKQPYLEIWLFKYPEHFGDMPPRKSVFPYCDIRLIKTFEDW